MEGNAMRKFVGVFPLCCLLLLSGYGCATSAVKSVSVSPRPLSATEVYDLLSPAMAFVHTPGGSGSGALIDRGYIVTNAHVVWPYPAAGITFPDGTILESVPVAYLDHIADLALLGPVSVDISPLTFTPREDIEVGSDVYLIGYPLETEALPRTTIARGILSRVREWDEAGITFFQTDASVAGGQSGGILSTSRGEVIGISSLATAGRSFAFVASALDVLDRLGRMASGIDVDGLGRRGPWTEERKAVHEFRINNRWDTAAFIAESELSMAIDLSARSDQDLAVQVLADRGKTLRYANEYREGQAEELHLVAQPGLLFILVQSITNESSTVRLEGSLPLARIPDLDDGRRLQVGQSLAGNADFPLDTDWYLINLAEGQRIAVAVESVMIDPMVGIDRLGVAAPIQDDDSGGGILGKNSLLVFEAKVGGDYLLLVSDSGGRGTGGYVLNVAAASPDAYARSFDERDQLTPPPATTLPESKSLPADAEAEREWKKYFDFLPEGWSVDSEFFRGAPGAKVPLVIGGGRFTGFGYDPNVTILRFPAPRNMVLSAMTDEMVRQWKNRSTRVKLVSRENVTLDSVPGERIEMLVGSNGPDLRIIQVFLVRGSLAWLLQGMCTATHEEAALCSELLESFHFPEDSSRAEVPFDTVMVAAGFRARVADLYKSGDRKKAEEQLELFNRFAESLGEGDPGYAETFQTVGELESMLGRYERAIDCLKRAAAAYSSKGRVEQLGSVLNSEAWAYYLAGRYAEGEPVGRQASAIQSAVRGPDHAATIATSHTLAMLLVGLARYQEAEGLLRGAAAFAEQRRGINDEITVGYLTDLATLLQRSGKYAEAREIIDRLAGITTPPPDWASVGDRLPAEKH
jgi:tetratricopeptide (TPR) repeat protein